jgi:O-succinylbenzoate synthase
MVARRPFDINNQAMPANGKTFAKIVLLKQRSSLTFLERPPTCITGDAAPFPAGRSPLALEPPTGDVEFSPG